MYKWNFVQTAKHINRSCDFCFKNKDFNEEYTWLVYCKFIEKIDRGPYFWFCDEACFNCWILKWLN